MNDLIRCEWRRFQRIAWLAAAGHLLLLAFVQRQADLLQLDYFSAQPLFALMLAAGFGLALWQVGSYRRPSQWLWLIHRPLSPNRIFAALALSATAVLAIVLLLPPLVLVAGLDLLTTRVVDLRHYLMPPIVFGFALMAWLAGCHAVLARHKAAVLLLPVPLVLGMHLVSVWWLLLLVVLGLGWLAFVAARGVRADRAAPLPAGPALLATALPLQIGFFLLSIGVMHALLTFGGILLGSDPLNTEYPPPGGLIEVQRAMPADALALGLAASDDPRASAWRAQLPLLEPVEIGMMFRQRQPLRQQFGNLQLLTQWFDDTRGILWTFSHDRMRFHGRDPKTGAEHGWWGLHGLDDPTPFPVVPELTPDQMMLVGDTLYAVDDQQQTQHALLQIDTDETFAAYPLRALDRLFVITDRRLLCWRDDRDATSPFAPPLLDWQLPLPGGLTGLAGVTAARLMDGWLLSFVHDDGHRQIGLVQYSTIAEPWQQVDFVTDDGHVEVVARRPISRDFPVLQQVAWWLSPVLHGLTEWPAHQLDLGLVRPLRSDRWPAHRGERIAAGVLLLLAVLLASAWLRDTTVPAGRRRFWLASCALLGLPALFSLICLEPRIRRQR